QRSHEPRSSNFVHPGADARGERGNPERAKKRCAKQSPGASVRNSLDSLGIVCISGETVGGLYSPRFCANAADSGYAIRCQSSFHLKDVIIGSPILTFAHQLSAIPRRICFV